MSKYGDDIRRISGYEKLLKLIREAQDTADQAKKLAIDGKKSIAYLDRSSLGSSTSSGTPGVTKPNGSGANIDNKNTSAGSGIGSANPFSPTGTGQNTGGSSSALDKTNPLNGVKQNTSTANVADDDNTTRDGEYNADDLMNKRADSNGKEPPVPSSQYSSFNPSSTSAYQPQTVEGITGVQTDDETRQLIVRFATAFIGPSDWTDAFNGPDDPTYDQGLVWVVIDGVNTYYGSTLTEIIEQKEGNEGLRAYGVSGGFVTNIPPVAGEDILFSSSFDGTVGDPTGPLGGTIYTFQAYIATTSISLGNYGQQDCGLVTNDDEAAACGVTEAPPVTSWGTDLGLTQLAWVTPFFGGVSPYAYQYVGRFMPNPFDTNVPGPYLEGASILDIKTLGGDEIRIGPLKEGGWYMYYRDPGNDNLPIGPSDEHSVLTINVNRTVNGFITPANLEKLLP